MKTTVLSALIFAGACVILVSGSSLFHLVLEHKRDRTKVLERVGQEELDLCKMVVGGRAEGDAAVY